MFEKIKKHEQKIAAILCASLIAGNIFYNPTETKAEASSDFQLNASWLNSPTIESDGYSSKTEYNWTAKTEETRSVSMSIEYIFDNSMSSSGFPEDSIEIHVPGLREAYREDPKEATITFPDDKWDYTYDEASDEYIITNVNEISMLTGFAGEITLSYEMNSREIITMTDIPIQPYAVVRDENIEVPEALTFSFESDEDQYQIKAEVKTVGDSSDFGEDDLNIVRYEVTESIQNASRGTYDKYYLISDLGDGIVLGYSDGVNISTDMEVVGVGAYKIPYAPTRQIYVGYPKDKTDSAEHTFTLYGSYYDVDIEEELAYTTTTVDIKNFDFIYNGELYMIGKTGYDTVPDENRISLQSLQNGYIATYSLSAVARYTDPYSAIATLSLEHDTDVASPSNATPSNASPSNASSNSDDEDDDYIGDGMLFSLEEPDMDVWIIDDFIYAQDENGQYRELDGNEYDIKSITIPENTCFTNEDGLAFSPGKYNADILINTFDRNAKAYKTVPIDKNKHKITLPANTDRVMVRISGLYESLYLEHGNMWLEVEFNLDDSKQYLPGGYVRNLDSIWVDWNDIEHHNSVDPLVSYPGDDDDIIKNRDIDAYGVYMQRNYFDYHYISRNIQGLLLMSQEVDDSYDDAVRSDRFITTDKGYETFVNFTSVFTNVTNGSRGWTTYTILPEGMEINHDESVVFDVRLPSGLSLSVNNMKITEQKNYKGSGRTYVSMTYDFANQLVAPANGIIMAAVEIPVYVSYKAAARNTAYPVWGISTMRSPDTNVTPTSILESAYPGQAKGGIDDGTAIAAAGTDEAKLWSDIDRDGDKEDTFVFNNIMLNITDLAAVNMEVISYVRNESSDFSANIDDSHTMTEVSVYPGHPYVYRLNAVNTGALASKVVFYDTLETAQLDGVSGSWKGTFNHVDLSALEAYGLTPSVYYSTSESPTYDYTSSEWVSSVPANKNTVKAIAVVADADDDFVLSDNVFVDVYLDAPTMADMSGRNLHGTNTLNRYTLIYDTATGTKSLNSNITGVTIYETATVKITKLDKDTNAKLAGAVFTLYPHDDLDNPYGTFTSNESGEILIENLPYGEFILRETTPPFGYAASVTDTIIYAGPNTTMVGSDGAQHEFKNDIDITIYNKLATDRKLTITKRLVDSDGAAIFGDVSFIYRVEGKDLNGNSHVWSVIITPENGYGSKTIFQMPVSDKAGYKVTELTSNRYQISSISGTHTLNNADLENKTISVDLNTYQDGQADYVNTIKRWDKFTWSSSVINSLTFK